MSKPIWIVRASKDKDNPYKAVRRAIFEDNNLSLSARGLMGYILMKPDDWQVNIKDVMRSCKIGRDKAYGLLNELIDNGYAERVEDRSDGGKFGETRIRIYETPHTEKPDTVSPDTVSPDTVNQEHTNKEHSTKEEKTTKKGMYTPTPQQEMFGAVCEIVGWDYKALTKADQGQVAQTVGTLVKAGYSLDDMRRFMTDVWFRDWRWEKNQQRPSLSQLRQEIGKLRAHTPPVQPTGGASVVHSFFAKAREQGADV